MNNEAADLKVGVGGGGGGRTDKERKTKEQQDMKTKEVFDHKSIYSLETTLHPQSSRRSFVSLVE